MNKLGINNIHVIDIETYWDSRDYTLSKMGPVEYARDPRAYCQLLAVATNNDPLVEVAANHSGVNLRGGDDVENRLRNFHKYDAFVAHNGAGFDFIYLSEMYNFGTSGNQYWDTIPMMRWCGLSSICGESHKALTEKLGNGIKQAGTVVSDGKRLLQEFNPAELKFFKQYCRDDAAQCRENFKAMLPYMTSDALQFMSITARMAVMPVFVISESVLDGYISWYDDVIDDYMQALSDVFKFQSRDDFIKSIRSYDSYTDILARLNISLPTGESGKVSYSKTNMDFMAMLGSSDRHIVALVEVKLLLNNAGMIARAKTLKKFAGGGPVPIVLSAFKAHTGRYTAGGSDDNKTDALQFQNLSKHNPENAALREAIQAPAGMTVVAADSRQIEARVNAWFCRQDNVTRQFRAGEDVYAHMGAALSMGKYTAEEIVEGKKDGNLHAIHWRKIGKMFTLSAGYGIGTDSLAKKLWLEGIRLDNSGFGNHLQAVRVAHSIYKYENIKIVDMWKKCDEVIADLAKGGRGQFGGPLDNLVSYGIMPICGRDDWSVPTIMLPSGFGLRYPRLRSANGRDYVYDRWNGRTKKLEGARLYGAMLLENIVSALAMQILMWQACRMDEKGISLAGNNHDCWYAVVPNARVKDTADVMRECMLAKPIWAASCPIDVEINTGFDFTVA